MRIVTFRLRVMLLIEESYGENTGELAGRNGKTVETKDNGRQKSKKGNR